MPAGPTPGGGLGRNAYARDRPVIASRHAVVGPAAARGLGRRISYGIVEDWRLAAVVGSGEH